MLADLVALYVEGHRGAAADAVRSLVSTGRAVGENRGKAWGSARDAWENDRFNPEAEDPAHRLLLADLGAMNALLRAGFADYAKRLVGPDHPADRGEEAVTAVHRVRPH